MTDLRQFINQYQLSKTLRFDLIPEPGTEKLVRTLLEIPEQNHHAIVQKDLELAKSYKKVKKLIDCRHREIIDNVLSCFRFNNDELKILYDTNSEDNENEEEISADNNDTENEKELIKKLREKLSKELDKQTKIMFDNKLLNVAKSKNRKNASADTIEKCDLERWMDTAREKYLELGENENIDKNTIKDDLKRLNGFFTYFNDFNENRKNVYTGNKISTAIPFRIIDVNFPIFKNNIKNYEKIKNDPNHAELVRRIDEKGANEIFQLSYFNECLTQNGIDVYNKEKLGIIAEKQGNEQQKGINQIINEYVQQKNKEIKENTTQGEKPKKIKIATFDKLKKQILSINKTKSFQFDVLESTHEIIDGINGRYVFLSKVENGTMSLKDEIKNFLASLGSYDLNEVYLNAKFINKLSIRLFGYGRYIDFALEKWYDDKKNKSEKDKQKFLESKQFTIQLIHDSIKYYLDTYEQDDSVKNKYASKDNIIVAYFKNPHITVSNEQDGEAVYVEKGLFEELESRRNAIKHIFNNDYTKDLREEKNTDGVGIKAFLDVLLEFNYILSPFTVKDKKLEKDEGFYNKRKSLQDILFEAEILDIYNQTRNYITKKTYKSDKFRLMFGNPQFAGSWPSQKEKDYRTTILRDQGEYKLLIFPKGYKLIYSNEALTVSGNDYYEKMFYDQMADPAKDIPNLMVENGKTVRKTGRKEKEGEFEGQNLQLEKLKNELLPSEINRIRKSKSYLTNSDNFNNDDLQKFIDYYKQRVTEYKSSATFVFKNNYKSFLEFTKHVDEQAYQLNFNAKISKTWIDRQVQEGKIYLFKIHNKDFNPGSTGRKNLHTLYWEMLFDRKNLENVIFKLNGDAKLFYREASNIKNNTIHKIGDKVPKKFFELDDGTLEPVSMQIIKNLNYYFNNDIPIEKWDESSKKYKDNYSVIGQKRNGLGIVKDERFTKDKIQFHCSITMNFKSANKKDINDDVLKFLHKRDDVHIIGLDRGERNLIYLTMVNKAGKIIDGMQISLNELERNYEVNGKKHFQKINYHELLQSKEVNRTEARKNWQTIENIKNLKEGYLSLVIHQLAKLAVESNAIIVMEDLNYGFKDSRANVEKQIYQKFENMLIKKLQYFVINKDNLYNEGGVLKAYQLTNEKIPAYKSMGKQNGILFYVPPDYTSKIDPKTGFVNLLDTRYTNRNNAINFLNKFDKIYYDTKNQYFRFEFDYKNFSIPRIDITKLTRTKWSVCSHSSQRAIMVRVNNKWKPHQLDINSKLKELFEKQKNINFKSGNCLKEPIREVRDAKFFEELLKYLFVLLSLRHTWKSDDGVVHDMIVSSVEKIQDSNEFYCSKNEMKKGKDKNGKWQSEFPVDADANGAYNIARKGLWLLNKLDEINNKEEAVKNFNKLKKAKIENEDKKKQKKEKNNKEPDNSVSDTNVNRETNNKKKKKTSQWCPNNEWLNFAQK
ncbi:MAG: type V CRISPR-associated protein Cas12a/Cpf1 [Bacteroidales bacterium]|jgi:CRISPR-associated protein Cpf1|nr:type V CRISPR-associated protein Cas12a/Cpf1 [Bacteroidales bacterium]